LHIGNASLFLGRAIFDGGVMSRFSCEIKSVLGEVTRLFSSVPGSGSGSFCIFGAGAEFPPQAAQ